MKASLKIKLIVSYLLISLLLIVSLLMFARSRINREFGNYVRQNLEIRCGEIAARAIDIYKNSADGHTGQLYRQIGDYAVDQGLVLRIRDDQGNLIWCMDCEDPEQCMHMLTGIESNMDRLHQGFDGEYSEFVYPVEQDGERLGSVELGYYGPFYYDSLDVQFLRILDRLFLIAAAGALALSVILGLYMAGRISKPVRKVIRQTKLIEEGNYQSLIQDKSTTAEIGELIHSVNTLASTLETQKKLRKRLAQDYAHEFRTPLASLQSNLEAMIDGIWTPTKERLLSLDEELKRLSRMVGELDYLVEVENDLVLERSEFDLLELIKTSVSNFESDIYKKKLNVTITGQMCMVFADRDKMGQVVVNLLSNAVKYSTEEGQIKLLLSQSEQEVLLQISDNGIGITEEDLSNIFEHLYRADRSRTAGTGGSGIGLAVVKAIVEAHGGSIKAESREGVGSKFTISIKSPYNTDIITSY